MAKPTIGCLALQGCVERHRPHVEAAGAEFRAVKTPAQFAEVDAFILPGGESTTMLKLIERFNLWDELAQQFSQKPVWGICAGSILLAETVLVQPKMSPCGLTAGSPATRIDPAIKSQDDNERETQKSFGILPITVERNGYGRQLESCHTLINGYEVSLIRAPVIKETAKNVEVMAQYQGDPVWVRHGHNMATTFHPELTFDFPSPMHKMFVEIVRTQSAQGPAKEAV